MNSAVGNLEQGGGSTANVSYRAFLTGGMRDCVPLILHWIGFVVFSRFVFLLGELGPADYESAFLTPIVGWNLIASPLTWMIAAGLLPAVFLPLLFSRFPVRTLSSWHQVEHGRLLRFFAVGLSVIVAITFAGQSVNLFFGQEYLPDRVLLLVLAVGIWLHPIMIVPFTVMVVAVGGQIAIPVSGYGWDRHFLGINRLPIQLLVVICVGTLVRLVDKPSKSQSTTLLIVIVIASFYWVPGFGKLRSGWVMVPNVHLALFGSWSHGWLSGYSGESIAKFTQQMAVFAIPMQVTVLLIECGAVFIANRRVALFLLPMWALFHLGAWAMFGYSFWAWILIDGTLFVFVFNRPNDFKFGWSECIVAFLLVGSSGLWLNPNRLAWFNAPLANSYRVFATTSEGESFEIAPAEFAPYDYLFTMQFFSAISSQHQLVGPYGATSVSQRALMDGAVLAVAQAKTGERKPDLVLRGQLTSLLSRYVIEWNSGRDNHSTLSFLATPALLNSTVPKTRPAGSKIVAVRIVRVRSYLTDETAVRETVEECLEIEFGLDR